MDRSEFATQKEYDDYVDKMKGLPKPVFSFLGKWDDYINNKMKDVNK